MLIGARFTEMLVDKIVVAPHPHKIDKDGKRHYLIRAIPYQDPQQEAERLKAVHETRVEIGAYARARADMAAQGPGLRGSRPTPLQGRQTTPCCLSTMWGSSPERPVNVAAC